MRRPAIQVQVAWLGTWLLACAGGLPSAAPRGAPRDDAALAERVLAVLERHHLTGRVLDHALAARAHGALRERLSPDGAACAGKPAPPAALERALRRGRLAFARALSAECGWPVPPPATAREHMLDALARGFDPHSAYLTPEAQARASRLSPGERTGQARGRLLEREGRRLGWLVLPSFYLRHDGHRASRDLAHIATTLRAQGATALVLDLRGNAGGAIQEAVRTLGVFGCAGPVARARNRDGDVETLRAPQPGGAYDGPLAVLIDAGSASASELFAAAVQDRGRGIVIGARSFGKGTQQSLIHLASPLGAPHGALQVTTRELLRLDGRSLQRRGVIPDVAADDGEPARLREDTLPGALPAGSAVEPVGACLTPLAPSTRDALRARLPAAARAGDDPALEAALWLTAHVTAAPPRPACASAP